MKRIIVVFLVVVLIIVFVVLISLTDLHQYVLQNIAELIRWPIKLER